MNADNKEIINRDEDDLELALYEADNILMKNYQYQLSSYPVVPINEDIKAMDVTSYIRLFKIESIAYDKREDNFAKLVNVYNALLSVRSSIVLIIDSDNDKINFYIGTKNIINQEIHIAGKTLEKALRGNFPGCQIKNQNNNKIKSIISDLFHYRDDSSAEPNRTICAVSGISNWKETFDSNNSKEFAQGIEKLIDSMLGEVYSIVIIADPIEQQQIDNIRKGYEQLYTRLVPFANTEISLGRIEGKTLTNGITEGIADAVSESLTLTQSHSHTESTSKFTAVGGGVSSKGLSFSASRGKSKTEADTYSESHSETNGNIQTKSFNINISDAIVKSNSSSILIRTEERSVKTLLERIDMQLNRLNECGDIGMWNCAAYIIADDLQTSKTVASTYQALIRGKNSGLETTSINTWDYHENDEYKNANYTNFSEYLLKLMHPSISLGNEALIVNPTALISGTELTVQAGLPLKSVSGLAVSHYATFGREVLTDRIQSGIELGKIYHVGTTEKATVLLDKQKLTSHTFVTGSTGSGKTNTIYQIIDNLCMKKGVSDVTFLVIEPAKGEYKDVFGGIPGVEVFGTNPNKTKLLKINPFSFPDDIHVLEHIDRLVEIFNACWPMYAAMPAVLKESIENTYINLGWSLTNSICIPRRFPTFTDLILELPKVIDNSSYSKDTKSDYTGALVTRVRSLTNGISGQIFCGEVEIQDEILFDTNVIVDLNRIGSVETKALIMGIIIMKLHEYRMSVTLKKNLPLKHITVLEEAHNLLRRTSMEQTQENSNLQGKSVEMLTNAIAEMRTYGEGFIIADQSPGLLDMAVIRNTNTKIIMRLPDESDRLLVGKAAGLNDEQIIELAKLKVGVAAVYQNDWIEPVLCAVNHYTDEEPLKYENNGNSISPLKQEIISRIVGDKKENTELTEEVIEQIKRWIDCLNTGKEAKLLLYKMLDVENELSEQERGFLLYCIVKGKSIIGRTQNMVNSETIRMAVDTQISDMLSIDLLLAVKVRKIIFSYAAQNIDGNLDYSNELLINGGVK